METKPNGFFERAGNWIRNSVSIRMFTIGIIILLLLIPVAMVESLISERQERQEEAIREVSSKWGESQTITGPVITVPYKSYSKVFEEKGSGYKLVESRSFAHFLPESLNIKGSAQPEVRYRGIYKVIVYNAQMDLKGAFKYPDFEGMGISPENILWNEAFVSVGLSDLRSIQENISVDLGGVNCFFNPGLETTDVMSSGISSQVGKVLASCKTGTIPFEIKMNFNGSSALSFIPLGKETTVSIRAPWGDPKFDGAFLPDSRNIDKSGFSAGWKVLHLNRPYPQRFSGSVTGITESAFGVSLIVPVDEYQKSTRSAKYAAMLITLTFLLFFFAQVLYKVHVHPIQYLMVGLALCVFYTLLIALSEHISFLWSYAAAAASTIGLITLYAKSIFKNPMLTRVIFLVLSILYVFIYTIIQLEDYALLMGSVGLFIALATVMYLSRKIDWTGGDAKAIKD